MKILVCISKVPDTTTKISFTDNNTKFNEAGVQWIINPSDEWYALVRALEIKEANGGSVTILNVGPATNDPVIRKGLAIGADDAVRIDAEELDSMAVAKEIAEYAKTESYDIIFCGKETIDYNGSIIPAMVAEHLDLNLLSLVSKMEISGNTISAERDIEGGTESISANTPVVIAAAKGLAEARIPNMRGIMAARTKPLKVVPSCGAEAKTTITNFEAPPAKASVKLVDPDNVEELVRLLHEEAKAF